MGLLNEKEFVSYIQTNYPKVYETEKWNDFSSEIDGFCENCRRDVFFKIRSKIYQESYYYHHDNDLPSLVTYFIECPKCSRKRFVQLLLLKVIQTFDKDGKPVEAIDENDDDEDNYSTKTHYELYKLYNLPTQEESFAIKDIPDEYSTLKQTISEAMFTMTHGKFISAAIMFRRGLQIITKDILGAKGRTLHNQLEWLKENKNLLAIDLTELFHDNGKLIKDVGNQGAHPDEDITLHTFSEVDVNSLHDLFLVIINEIFIKPEKLKTIQSELIKNRKLKI
jgi:hypothetical protein